MHQINRVFSEKRPQTMKMLYLVFVLLFVNCELVQAVGEEPPSWPTASNCGLKSNFLPLMLSGTVSREGEHPWLVALFYFESGKYRYRCAGTLASNRHIITAVREQPPSWPVASNCGLKSNILPLVLSGTVSREGEHPWLVALFYFESGKYNYRCAGTLASNRHIITAAHCVNGTDKRNLYVILGKTNIGSWGPNTISRNAERIIMHPDFVHYSYADVAVIRMNAPVTFGDFVRPICLWDESSDLAQVVGEKGTVAGWGADEAGKTYVDQARQIEIPIVDEVTCLRAAFAFTSLTSNKTFCAGKRDGRIPCRGDSGGGFVMERGKRWRLRGVVSSALSSNSKTAICDGSQYAVFSDVAKFDTWLKDNLREAQEEVNTNIVKDVVVASSRQMCEKGSKIQRNSSSNVEGGDFNSSAREFPHMAAFGVRASGNIHWFCEGSLISEYFILTAADCTGSINLIYAIIRLGDYSLSITTDDAKPQDYNVKRVILHPDYKPPSKYNDIGLLELTNRVTFNDYIKPACLQHNEQVLDKNWITTGWTQGSQEPEDYLLKDFIKQIPNERCNKYINTYQLNSKFRNGLTAKQICAGNDNAAKDNKTLICKESTGTPLQVQNDFGSYNILGVLSSGLNCNQKYSFSTIVKKSVLMRTA